MRHRGHLRLAITAHIVALCVTLSLEACDSPTSARTPLTPLIQTNQTSYMLSWDGQSLTTTIGYVFTNRTGGTVYLPNCQGEFDVELERAGSASWNVAWAPVIPACLSPPIVIKAGATVADTLLVTGGLPGSNVGPQFDRADPSGTYRLVWTQALSSYDPSTGFGRIEPGEDRVSNSFELTAPGGS